MAISFTFMFGTVENSFTFFTTLEYLPFFTTFHNSCTFSTLTSNKSSLVLTGFTLSLMTELRTRMRTIWASFSPTNLSTRMRFNISFVFRIFEFSTITIILWHGFIILKLALRTAPGKYDLIFLFVSINIQNPGLNTFQVHRNITTIACPNIVSLTYRLRANYAIFFLEMAALFLNQFRFFIELSLRLLILFLFRYPLMLSIRFLFSLSFLYWILLFRFGYIFWLFALFISIVRLLVFVHI